ncbi:MAG TPA: peptidylprolyl isomerase [Bryobacteraceae bacterium]|nr:peptidylprolyl isomerase [Bryobacteraceae bacterium]
MKTCGALFVIAASLFGQATPVPPMAIPSSIPPATVVAEVNGKKMTAGEIQRIVQNSPPQVQQAYSMNPKEFLRQYAWYSVIEDLAMKNKLDQKSPYKDQLAFYRMYTLVQGQFAEMNVQVPVSAEDQKQYYDKNKDKFRETKAKLIYVPFSKTILAAPDAKGKKLLTEAEASTRAAEVVKKARAGEDFVKLVKEYSEDPNSAEKGGDLGLGIRPTTNQVPEVMKNAVLALKEGDVSDPIRHENGFYVFKAQSTGVLPYDQVKDEIFRTLKEQGFQKWQQETKNQSSVKFENEAFFTKSPEAK